MDANCGTCRHWVRWDAVTGPYEYDHRRPPPGAGEWGWCDKVDDLWPPAAARFYVSVEDDHARLGTRSDFGCTEHEAETAEEAHARATRAMRAALIGGGTIDDSIAERYGPPA